MTLRSSAFGTYFLEQLEGRLDELTRDVGIIRETFSHEEYVQRRASIKHALVVIGQGIASDTEADVAAFAQQLGENRARQRFNVEVMLRAFRFMRTYVIDYMQTYLTLEPHWEPRDGWAVEDVLHTYLRSYFGGFSNVYQEMQSDLMAQAAELERQRELIRELSSPIVPIAKDVLLLPLVGTIDDARSNRIIEALLETIVATQSELVLIDITGVALIDTSVASHLLNLTRAVSLLGAHIVLVGISPEVAQTMVQLGIDMSSLIILKDLQAGVAYAFKRQGIST